MLGARNDENSLSEQSLQGVECGYHCGYCGYQSKGDWNMAGANYFKLPCELFWGGLPMAGCQLDCHYFGGKSNQATLSRMGRFLAGLPCPHSPGFVKKLCPDWFHSYRFAYAFTRESRAYLALYNKARRLLISRVLHSLIFSSSSLEEETMKEVEKKENCLQGQ